MFLWKNIIATTWLSTSVEDLQEIPRKPLSTLEDSKKTTEKPLQKIVQNGDRKPGPWWPGTSQQWAESNRAGPRAKQILRKSKHLGRLKYNLYRT